MLDSLNLALPHCGGRDWGPFWFFLRSGKEQGVFSYHPAHLCAGEASVDFPYRQWWEQWPEDRAGLLGRLWEEADSTLPGQLTYSSILADGTVTLAASQI